MLPGTRYFIKITPSNDYGPGPSSKTHGDTLAQPAQTPGKMLTPIVATHNNGEILVTWSPPNSDTPCTTNDPNCVYKGYPEWVAYSIHYGAENEPETAITHIPKE